MADSTDNARGPELLPCPFCGEAGEYESRHYVSCSNEGCWAFYKTRSVTAPEWNTRADLAAFEGGKGDD